MRRLNRALAGGALLLAIACAHMGPPPGGPPDVTAPRLLATFPESVAVLPNFDGWVEFKFDETVSEGSQPNFGLGTGDLEKLVLLSPSKQVPRVEWHRSRILVKPREGWRPNTVYRIELAPGIRDLMDGRPNETKTGYVVTFATGGELPRRTLQGRAVDWIARKFLGGALVEATLLPDSLVYRALADSTGRFVLGPLPDGEFLVSVTGDQNHDAKRNGKEPWDTVRVGAGVASVGEVWTFPRDTVAPRATDITRVDSVTIALTMSLPLDPALRIPAESIRVLLLPDSSTRGTDSTSLGPVTALPQTMHDSTWRAADEAARAAADAAARAKADSAKPDSLRARPDTTPKARPPAAPRDSLAAGKDTTAKDEPTQKRPALDTRLVIRTRGPTRPGHTYFVQVRGVRAMAGRDTTITRTLVVPLPPKPKVTAADSARAKADTLRARPDSTKPPADTTRLRGSTRP